MVLLGCGRSPRYDMLGAYPQVELLKGRLDFGAPPAGAAVDRDVTVRNADEAPLLVTWIAIDEEDGAREFDARPAGSVDWVLAPAGPEGDGPRLRAEVTARGEREGDLPEEREGDLPEAFLVVRAGDPGDGDRERRLPVRRGPRRDAPGRLALSARVDVDHRLAGAIPGVGLGWAIERHVEIAGWLLVCHRQAARAEVTFLPLPAWRVGPHLSLGGDVKRLWGVRAAARATAGARARLSDRLSAVVEVAVERLAGVDPDRTAPTLIVPGVALVARPF